MPTVYKILGQVQSSFTTQTNLYTVPANTSAVVSSLVVCNNSTNATTIRVFVRPGGAAASTANTVAYDVAVPASTHIAFTEGWTLAATDVVTIQNGAANSCTYTLFGSEIS